MVISEEKAKLLNNLRNTYCRIKPSSIEGVGVFAIKDIPENINPFMGANDHEHIALTEQDLKDLDPEVADMVRGFFVFEGPEIWVAKNGLNSMDISQFMNHTDNPNVTFNEDDSLFYTLREIKKGEELTINYQKF